MEILSQVDHEIGWISLNRPSMRNAISKSMWQQLPLVLETLRGEGARVAVFQGEGLSFAAGADLVELAELKNRQDAEELWLAIRNALNAVAASALPTIAMIHGACMGGGCLLAAACDMRVCEPQSRFSVPVAQLGILLDDDNIARLISLVGRGLASEMLLTAQAIDAERAQRSGLVNRVVPVGKLRSEVESIARAIIANAPAAVSYSKSAIASISRRFVQEQDQEPMIASYTSDEFRARVAKALAKDVRPE